MLLARILKGLVKHGQLTFIDSEGRRSILGDRSELDLDVTLHIPDQATERKIILNPTMAMGEAYMDGTATIEGSIRDFLHIVTYNMDKGHKPPFHDALFTARRAVKWLQQNNPIGTARQNVAHHYDLSGQLYDLFLDKDRQYSCAYYDQEGISLEEAQLAKKRHLASKLRLEPDHSVLDIGSGWGGLALYLAEETGANVTGVTLSDEQYKISGQRAADQNLDQKVKFHLQDYRDVRETFDRIVSVGMFEHVGINHYKQFFRKVRTLLKNDGVAVIHSIGRSTPPTVTNPWTRKYIFPGGYIPALSEVMKEVEKSGLIVSDIEILRLHYAETLYANGTRVFKTISSPCRRSLR